MAYCHMKNINARFSSFHKGKYYQPVHSPPSILDIHGLYAEGSWYPDG